MREFSPSVILTAQKQRAPDWLGQQVKGSIDVDNEQEGRFELMGEKQSPVFHIF